MSGQVQSNRDWQRPAGSPVIGWTKRARNSALAYLQPGHGPTAYANPHYRLLVKNAIEWSIRETETCRRALTR
jgi:type 1 glutamine amidotransferase